MSAVREMSTERMARPNKPMIARPGTKAFFLSVSGVDIEVKEFGGNQ
jgi:hypothetical protein